MTQQTLDPVRIILFYSTLCALASCSNINSLGNIEMENCNSNEKKQLILRNTSKSKKITFTYQHIYFNGWSSDGEKRTEKVTLYPGEFETISYCETEDQLKKYDYSIVGAYEETGKTAEGW